MKTPKKTVSNPLGKTESGAVIVRLGLARGDSHCLLDDELALAAS